MGKRSLTCKKSYNSLISQLDLYNLLFRRLPQVYRPTDALLHLTVLAVFMTAIFAFIVNSFTHQYTPLPVGLAFFTALPGVLLLWLIGMLLQPTVPRFGLFLSIAAQMYCFLIVSAIAISAIITTPFSLIDPFLLVLDAKLGFSSLGLLAWVHQFPWLVSTLQYAYDSWFFELMFTPLLLALLKKRFEIDRYILATFFSLTVSAVIYYFWPTVAPAGVLQSPYFTVGQHQLVQRFIEVHQSLPITVFPMGLIAFPSNHVINSLIVLYAWRQYRWLFYPLLLVNMVSIFATMGLGYHYLVDVLAGFVVASLSIKLATILLKKYSDLV